MSDKEFTKIVANTLLNAKNLIDWGVSGGHTTESELRLTIEARKEKAKQLVESGVSQRQAAKLLGVGEATIRNDVRNDCAKSAQKLRTEPDDDNDTDHKQGLRVIAARGFLNRAKEAKEICTIERLQASDITEAMIKAADDAGAVWTATAHNLRRMISRG